MSIFIICPVRFATEDQKEDIQNYIDKLEKQGYNVYYPARDTNQTDDTGYRICTDNYNAIKKSDEVHIYFDPNSKGTLFDLGIAFALRKPIRIINLIEKTKGKSFSNMILEWGTLLK
jgi:nucleoside 2-deoxyribosyltransferase